MNHSIPCFIFFASLKEKKINHKFWFFPDDGCFNVPMYSLLHHLNKKRRTENNHLMTEEHLTVGIDLGTTYSKCYAYNAAKKEDEVVPFSNGSHSLPSVVNFGIEPAVVGQFSEKQVYQSKRFIGKKYDDLTEDDKEFLPFGVERAEDGSILIDTGNEHIGKLRPEEISACILYEIKGAIYNKYYNLPRHVVITVPASFNDEQRKLTR